MPLELQDSVMAAQTAHHVLDALHQPRHAIPP
jgi:hypothetical protein